MPLPASSGPIATASARIPSDEFTMRQMSFGFFARRPMHLDGGFTLIELITVVAIVAILAGVAVPILIGVSTARSAMAAKQVLRDMTFARQRAVATGAVSWVVFNAGAGTWSILAENPSSPGRAGAAVLNDMATGRPYTT